MSGICATCTNEPCRCDDQQGPPVKHLTAECGKCGQRFLVGELTNSVCPDCHAVFIHGGGRRDDPITRAVKNAEPKTERDWQEQEWLANRPEGG